MSIEQPAWHVDHIATYYTHQAWLPIITNDDEFSEVYPDQELLEIAEYYNDLTFGIIRYRWVFQA